MNRVTEGPRATTRLTSEAGFGLIEAIAAAAVLALLALGVLAGIDGAAGASGREKARAVAGALAEQDQERMRGMRAADLPEYRWTRPVDVDGVSYTIKSEADWVSDSTASEVTCTTNGGKADFIRLRTTVTSATIGAKVKNVRIDSLIAPPIGSSGGSNGTLSVQVQNRDAGPVTGMAVTINGEDSAYTATKTTNALGCAIFAYAPVDTYDVALNSAGFVDTEGVQAIAAETSVTAGATTILPLLYDRKGSLAVSFETQYVDRTSTATVVRKRVASRAWSLSVTNPGMSTNLGRRIFPATTATAPLATITADPLFPFLDGYGVFPGRCAEQAPSLYNPTWAATVGNASKFVDRATSLTMTVRQPALPVRIAYGTRTATPQNGKPVWVSGANVRAKLVVPATSDCAASPDLITGITSDATNGLQSYPSGQTFSGTLSATSNYTDGYLGFVTKKVPSTTTWNAGYFDPGLPWGTWQVCADNGTRRNFATVVNKDPEGVANYVVIDLNGTGSAAATCANSSTWPAPGTAVTP